MAGEPLLRRHFAGVIFVEECDPPSELKNLVFSNEAALLAIAQAADIPVLQTRGAELSDLLADDTVISRIAELKRRVLVLAGGLLEGAVTQVALSALVEGFDVFIAADLVWTAEPEREQLFFNRISAGCGVILTRRQILLELLAHEQDEDRRARLNALLVGAPA